LRAVDLMLCCAVSRTAFFVVGGMTAQPRCTSKGQYANRVSSSAAWHMARHSVAKHGTAWYGTAQRGTAATTHQRGRFKLLQQRHGQRLAVERQHAGALVSIAAGRPPKRRRTHTHTHARTHTRSGIIIIISIIIIIIHHHHHHHQQQQHQCTIWYPGGMFQQSNEHYKRTHALHTHAHAHARAHPHTHTHAYLEWYFMDANSSKSWRSVASSMCTSTMSRRSITTLSPQPLLERFASMAFTVTAPVCLRM
jgi:hypothetical protein